MIRVCYLLDDSNGQHVLDVLDRMCLVKWAEFVRCNGQNVLVILIIIVDVLC